MNSNISLKDFISYVEDRGRLKVFADLNGMSEQELMDLASRAQGYEIASSLPSRLACQIFKNGDNLRFNFSSNEGLYANTNDSNAAALIAAYCGMTVVDEVPEKSQIEKFVDACKQDIHKEFLDICGGCSRYKDGATEYSINGISCEIQPLRDTDGQNFFVFSVVKTGEQIEVVSDPVFAAMCAIKYGMVEGVTGKIEKQNTPNVLREISDNADQVIAKCLQISDNEYRAAIKYVYYSKDWSYGDLNVMVSISAYKTNFRLSRTIENVGNEPVLTTTDNEVFAHALKRYGIYDLACGLTKEPQIDTPVPKLKAFEAYIGEQALQQFETIDKYESKKQIKHQTLKEKIDAHNDELANQIILKYHEGLINSMQMAEQFQALRNNMLDTFASYSLS
jgi:hypothetical protein